VIRLPAGGHFSNPNSACVWTVCADDCFGACGEAAGRDGAADVAEPVLVPAATLADALDPDAAVDAMADPGGTDVPLLAPDELERAEPVAPAASADATRPPGVPNSRRICATTAGDACGGMETCRDDAPRSEADATRAAGRPNSRRICSMTVRCRARA
jgi:hypothetical protein